MPKPHDLYPSLSSSPLPCCAPRRTTDARMFDAAMTRHEVDREGTGGPTCSRMGRHRTLEQPNNAWIRNMCIDLRCKLFWWGTSMATKELVGAVVGSGRWMFGAIRLLAPLASNIWGSQLIEDVRKPSIMSDRADASSCR